MMRRNRRKRKKRKRRKRRKRRKIRQGRKERKKRPKKKKGRSSTSRRRSWKRRKRSRHLHLQQHHWPPRWLRLQHRQPPDQPQDLPQDRFLHQALEKLQASTKTKSLLSLLNLESTDAIWFTRQSTNDRW